MLKEENEVIVHCTYQCPKDLINWGIEPMGFIFKRITECRTCLMVSLSFKIDVAKWNWSNQL